MFNTQKNKNDFSEIDGFMDIIQLKIEIVKFALQKVLSI